MHKHIYIIGNLSAHRILGLAAALFGFSALLGYTFGIEILYRPIYDGPATHSITATCAMLMGIALYSSDKKGISLLSGLVTLFLTLLVLGEQHFQFGMTRQVTPFYQIIADEIANGQNNSMGRNTALMYLMLSIGLTLRVFSQFFLAQIIGFLSLALPTISFVGYAYGLDNFHGQMSLLTSIIGLILSIASLASMADKGPLRAMLSPDVGGRVARTQVALGYFFPFGFGYLLSKSLSSSQNEAVSLVIVAISWSIVLLAAVTAVVLEKLDENMIEDQYLNATEQMKKYQGTEENT